MSVTTCIGVLAKAALVRSGRRLVLGASVPIVASLRHDPIEVRVVACVLASLVHAARAKATATAAAPGPAAARVAA